MARRQANDDPIERSFADILASPNGANFHLADLHIHTPADKQSQCPKNVDPSTSKGQNEIAQGCIQAAKKECNDPCDRRT
jgi:hypothetical protein